MIKENEQKAAPRLAWVGSSRVRKLKRKYYIAIPTLKGKLRALNRYLVPRTGWETVINDFVRSSKVVKREVYIDNRGDFHARSRFARPTIPEGKWGTTRSLHG